MIKIVDKKEKKKKPELPTLPFFTRSEDVVYLYYNKDDGKIGCISVSDDAGEIADYDSLSDLANAIFNSQEILEVEIHIIK